MTSPEPLRLIGPTQTLRPPTLDDAPALFALAGDPEVTRWFSWGPYTSPAEAEAWIAEQPARREFGVALALVVDDHRHGPAGIIELAEWSARDRRAVVGTWLGRRFWGTGCNTEAKALMALLAFTHLGLERLGAYADVANARSHAALAKAGYAREGVLRRFHRHGAAAKDVALYSLLRPEWASAPPVAAELRGALPPAFLAA